MAGGGKAMTVASGNVGGLAGKRRQNRGLAFARIGPLAPILEGHVAGRRVGYGGAVEDVLAADGVDVFDARRRSERLLELFDDAARPPLRGGVGKLGADDEVALILDRQETRSAA